MRSKFIEVTLKIPLPIDSPDGNGNIYAKEAFGDGSSANGKPIIYRPNDGTEQILGYINDAWIYDGTLIANGIIWYGGTADIVNKMEEQKIMQLDISAIGLSLPACDEKIDIK